LPLASSSSKLVVTWTYSIQKNFEHCRRDDPHGERSCYSLVFSELLHKDVANSFLYVLPRNTEARGKVARLGTSAW